MSKQEQLVLAQFFEEIAEAQISQDKIKQELSVNKQYDIVKLFNLISENDNYITPKVLQDFLSKRIKVTEHQLYMIFGKFDHQLEGIINLNTFKKEMNPLVKPDRNIRSNTDPVILFLSLVQDWIDKQRLLNVCRKQLKNLIRYESFDIIASQMKGFIGKIELEVFLKRNQIKMKNKEIEYLIHGLKRRSYFKITLEAFCQNIDPLQFGYYTKYKEAKQNEQQLEYQKRNQEEEKRIREMKEHEQKIENKARKQRRRQQAENIKQRQLEDQLKRQSQKAREESQKLLRKAVLEAEKLERLEVQQQKLVLEGQLEQAENQRRNITELRILNNHQHFQAQYLDKRINDNQRDLSVAKYSIRQGKAHLYQAQLINDINRQNIEVGLRRDRCLSDAYAVQRLNYLERDTQIQRIRRETAIGLAQRQQLQPYGYLQSVRSHVYRPSSSYTPSFSNNNVSPYYGNSLNATSNMRQSSYLKHSLIKQPLAPSVPASDSRLRTPIQVRNQQLQKSIQELDSKKRRLQDEIRTATGRKHPYS